jgi:hypothetical protein
MSTSKKKKRKVRIDFNKLDPDYKPFIVMNEHLQVWTGLKDGGRTLSFSNNIDDAKPLDFNSQFVTLNRLTLDKLEQIYI